MVEVLLDEPILEVGPEQLELPIYWPKWEILKKVTLSTQNKLIKTYAAIDKDDQPKNKSCIPLFTLTKSLNIERKLFQKPNMEDIDKIIMEEVIRILEKQDMPVNMIIEKLRPVIQYTDQARVINWIPFSKNKLVPDVKFEVMPNANNVYESNAKGIYKAIHEGTTEYFFNTFQQRAQLELQGKEAITFYHLQRALQALSKNYKDNTLYKWWEFFWKLLNLSLSGRVFSHKNQGHLCADNKIWYLGTTSISPKGNPQFFQFHKDYGGIINYEDWLDDAYPCLYIAR